MCASVLMIILVVTQTILTFIFLPRWLSLFTDSEVLEVIIIKHRDSPDKAGGGGLASPRAGPQVHKVIHLVNVSSQDGSAIYPQCQ